MNNSENGRQFIFEDQFGNPIEKPEFQKYDPDLFKAAGQELDQLNTTLIREAEETSTQSSDVFKRRCNALEEVRQIVEGAAQPLPQRDDLAKEKYFFVSYSRRNEEQARELYLSLCSGGVLSYWDNQETHAVLHKPVSQENQNVMNERKLVIGENYKEGLVKGVEENGYFMVFLTPEAIDKFDVIGGLEVLEAIKKNNTIIVAYTDEEVFDKLVVLAKDHPEYQTAVTALNGGVKTLLDKDDFSKNPRELCGKIIDTVLESESGTIGDYPKDMIKKRDTLTIKDVPLLEAIEILQKNEKEYGYKKQLEDCKSIIVSEINPESLIKTGKVMNQMFIRYFKDAAGTFADLRDALSNYGLKEKPVEDIGPMLGKDAYVLLPVSEGLMDIEPDEFQNIFTRADYRNPPLWVLAQGDFFPKLAAYLEMYPQNPLPRETKPGKQPEPESGIDFKLRFLRKLSEIQAMQITDTDLVKNPDGLARYLLKEQAMAESTKTFIEE